KLYWLNDGQAQLASQLQIQPQIQKAKNIIFFLADGTSIATFTAARILKGYRSGYYEREQTSWEELPYTGIIKTYSTDNIVTDSAASATAYLSGVKANQATIGVDVNVKYGIANRSTGVVTTTRITHASPAGNYAHTANRHWENDDEVNNDDANSEVCDDIAEQLVLSETGTKINVALGGGRRAFLPKEMTDEDGENGRRDDGKNLRDIWLASHNTDGHTGVYVGHRDDLLSVDSSTTDYLLGLFSSSHMDYKVDSVASQPSLEEMTQKAIEILQKNPNGFYLFRTHRSGSPLNEANSALEEAIEFEKAISKAVEMTSSDDTLIIVTADHGQPIVSNGYPARHDSILGINATEYLVMLCHYMS
ncbi:Membrane-bound alkaline phosphatase, partial [Armadillidium vulgare]